MEETIDIDIPSDRLAAPVSAFRMPKIPAAADKQQPKSGIPSGYRDMPRAIQAEEGLLSCCLLDPAKIGEAAALGIEEKSFYDVRHQIIWRAMVMLWRTGVQVETIVLAQALADAGELDEVGGLPFLGHLEERVETTIHFRQFAGIICEKAEARAVIRRAARAIEAAYAGEDPAEILTELSNDIHDLRSGLASMELPMVPLTAFEVIDDDDASVLLGRRYLVRGDMGILVSHSGVGKSAMCLQMVIVWAIGHSLGFHGIRSNGPLRQLIIQAEDSEADVAEVCASICAGLQLTPDQLRMVEENTRVVRDKIHRGDSFLRALEGYVKRWEPDIVWLNPLQAYVDGDITKGEDCGKFLREGLNRVNREEKFAYMLVHHTTKPPSGKNQSERKWHEHMYDMAGGAELVNAARIIMSLKARTTEGKFHLVLAKRGVRAGVVKEVEQGAGTRIEVCTKISLRHCTDMIEVQTKSGRTKTMPMVFWQHDDDPEPEVEHTKTPAGRPRKWPDGEVLKLFPSGYSKREPIGMIIRRARDTFGMTERSFRNYHTRFLEDGLVVLNDGDSKWFRPTVRDKGPDL